MRAFIEEAAAKAVTGSARVDEEGADAGRVDRRVKEGVRALFGLVAAEEGATLAPAATRDRLVVRGDNYKVGLVGDELRVDAKDVPRDRLGLLRGVIRGGEAQAGTLDEHLEGGDVTGLGDAEGEHVAARREGSAPRW